MNDKLYSTALSNYKKWADNNKAEVESDFNERHAMCKEMQSYTKERLQGLSEEEFFNLIAVSDAKQLEKIKKEASSLKAIRDELKFWDYNDVLKVFDSLSNAYESINSLGLAPSGLF